LRQNKDMKNLHVEGYCPGFGQDRVNFHRTPGRGTAGGVRADPTWPNRARYSIPCAVTLGSGGGRVARRERSRGLGVCGARAVRESGSVSVVFSPYLYRCCCCFPLFAVLLNCPYPYPPVSASFFSFSSARWRGEGRPSGAFVAGGSRNQNIKFGAQAWGGDNGRAEQRVLKLLSYICLNFVIRIFLC